MPRTILQTVFLSPQQQRIRRVFADGFSAEDISGLLLSFDSDYDALAAKTQLEKEHSHLAAVRRAGRTSGYVLRAELGPGPCAKFAHPIAGHLVISHDASLQEVFKVLTISDYCFVSFLNEVQGIITRDDIQKPPARMWLFGMITIIEEFLVATIEKRYPDESWREVISSGRLSHAKRLKQERERRGYSVNLVDCLQFSDKGQLLMKDPEIVKELGFDSKRNADRAVSNLESLRNNLAHSQDIVANDWDTIVFLARDLNRIISRLPTST